MFYHPDAMNKDLNEINFITNDAFSWLIGQFFKSHKFNQDSIEYINKNKRAEATKGNKFVG